MEKAIEVLPRPLLPFSGSRLSGGALKKDSFPNLRAAASFKRVLDGAVLYRSSPAA